MAEKSYRRKTHFFERISFVNCNLATKELSNHKAEYLANANPRYMAQNMLTETKNVMTERNQLHCFAYIINLVMETALNDSTSCVRSHKYC